MNQRPVTPNEFKEWKEDNHVTRWFLELLIKEALTYRKLVGSGMLTTIANTPEKVGQEYIRLMQRAEIFENLYGLEYQELKDFIEESKYVEVQINENSASGSSYSGETGQGREDE